MVALVSAVLLTVAFYFLWCDVLAKLGLDIYFRGGGSYTAIWMIAVASSIGAALSARRWYFGLSLGLLWSTGFVAIALPNTESRDLLVGVFVPVVGLVVAGVCGAALQRLEAKRPPSNVRPLGIAFAAAAVVASVPLLAMMGGSSPPGVSWQPANLVKDLPSVYSYALATGVLADLYVACWLYATSGSPAEAAVVSSRQAGQKNTAPSRRWGVIIGGVLMAIAGAVVWLYADAIVAAQSGMYGQLNNLASGGAISARVAQIAQVGEFAPWVAGFGVLVALLGIFVPRGGVAEATSSSVSASTRPCPHCAEQIQKAAVVCRWCGRDVPKEA